MWQDAAFTKVLTLNVQRVFTLTQRLLPLLRVGAAQGGKDGHVFGDPARVINASVAPFPSVNGANYICRSGLSKGCPSLTMRRMRTLRQRQHSTSSVVISQGD
jgi:hypothetical protein